MNAKYAENLLKSEREKGNKLAESYLNLLKDATPEMREYWLNFLGNMAKGFEEAQKQQIKK